MRFAGLIALLFWLVACAPVPRPVSDPFIYDEAAFARADHLVIGIPGALSPIALLAPLENLAEPGRVVAFYRLPGFDGRPADEYVNIDFAAAHIAATARAGGFARVDLVGHSTGSAIALEAAKLLRREAPQVQVRIAGISTALPAPQPTLAGVRGTIGAVGAATRARSLSPREVWLEYYRTLAFGRNVDANPEIARAADALVAANKDRIALPQNGLGQRHTRALRRWTNNAPETLQGVDITLYHGASDPIFPARAVARFAKSLPQAEVQLITGHGHLLMLTYPELWARIADQLKR